MGKLGNISGKDAVKAFEKAGWLMRGQVGSHRILTKLGVRSNLTVPMHSEVAQGTLRALIKIAGLTIDEIPSPALTVGSSANRQFFHGQRCIASSRSRPSSAPRIDRPDTFHRRTIS